MRLRAKAGSVDLVLICAIAVGLVGLLEIVDIVESITYALSTRPIVGAPSSPRFCFCGYSGFDSAPYRNVCAKWHFSQENATAHDLQMTTLESKPL